MKSPKPEGIWKSLRIAIILMVANILLVTNFYIYSMYINNQSIDLTLSAQSLSDPVRNTSDSSASSRKYSSISQALAYDLPQGYRVQIKSLDWPLSIDAIKARISACGANVDETQITSTVDSYRGVKGIEYTFSKDELDGNYTITVFPNKRFGSMEEIKKILSICPDGGQFVPKDLSLKAALFTDSCGTGVSGKACEQIKATIEPTLSIE